MKSSAQLKQPTPVLPRLRLHHKMLIEQLDLAHKLIEPNKINTSILKILTELKTLCQVNRLSLSFVHQQSLTVIGISGTTTVNTNSPFVHDLKIIMQEAADQNTVIQYPGQAANASITRAHSHFHAKYGQPSLTTMPILLKDNIVAVLSIEHKKALDEEEIERIVFLQKFLQNCIEILKIKYQQENTLVNKSLRLFTNYTKKLIGEHFYAIKIISVVTAFVLLFVCLVPGDYKIAGEAILEGRIQRVITAPIDGFIDSTTVRAGDIIQAGALIAKMDDRDLGLKVSKLEAELAKVNKDYREALATQERIKVGTTRAKIKQTQAELSLVQSQLNRLKITAPFRGVIIEGDLDHSLGSPVKQGDLLFKLAPLDDYRIIIKVDERMIKDLRIGHEGYLVLSAFPNKSIPIVVDQLTPVSIPSDGFNYFKVKAHLLSEEPLLRPGMQGYAKITVGQAKLIWIWLHDVSDWLKLAWWRL